MDVHASNENKAKTTYTTVVKWTKRLQIAFAVLVGIFVALTPELRSHVLQTPIEAILINLSFEVLMLVMTSCVFGMNKIPANFVSILFLRFYVFFQNARSPNASTPPITDSNQAAAWYSGWIGPLATYPWNSTSTAENCCAQSKEDRIIEEKFLFAILMLVLTSLSASYSKVDISKCENAAIITTSIGTSLSTVVLISSIAIDRLGKECHLHLVKFWALYSVVASLFLFVYATQRTYKRVRGKMRSNVKFVKTQMELVIFAINVCVIVHYLPLVHPGFSVYQTVVAFPYNVARILPHAIQTFVKSVSHWISGISATWAT